MSNYSKEELMKKYVSLCRFERKFQSFTDFITKTDITPDNIAAHFDPNDAKNAFMLLMKSCADEIE